MPTKMLKSVAYPNGIPLHILVAMLQVTRDARHGLLGDAEGFQAGAIALEKLGQILCGEVRNGLGRYMDELVKLSAFAQVGEDRSIEQLLKAVKLARNDAVHTGAYARHAAQRLAEVLSLLEDAITSTMEQIGDIMVPGPIIAEPWQLVAHVRQAMLANSFSYLPYLHTTEQGSQWSVISDVTLMGYLRKSNGNKESLQMRSRTISALVEAGLITPTLVRCMGPKEPIAAVAMEMGHLPVLVTERIAGQERLLGIVTAFDLL